jgi:hypothetical protein
VLRFPSGHSLGAGRADGLFLFPVACAEHLGQRSGWFAAAGLARQPRAPGLCLADPIMFARVWLVGTMFHLSPHDFTHIAGRGADAPEQAMALFRRIGPVASAMRQAAGSVPGN